MIFVLRNQGDFLAKPVDDSACQMIFKAQAHRLFCAGEHVEELPLILTQIQLFKQCLSPVSYTHLDVYKRQAYTQEVYHENLRFYRPQAQGPGLPGIR